MKVEFVWWGSFELLERLSTDEHIGRRVFWFGKQGLTREWFRGQLDAAIRAAGPRYTPDAHVDVPAGRALEVFGHTSAAEKRLRTSAAEVRRLVYDLTMSRDEKLDSGIATKMGEIRRSIQDVVTEITLVEFGPEARHSCRDVALSIEQVVTVSDALVEQLSALAEQYSKEHVGKGRSGANHGNPYWELSARLNRVRYRLAAVQAEFARYGRLEESPLLILTGRAGTGKTHLLCDVGMARSSEEAVTVVVMGQQLTGETDPWTQILQVLQLPGMSANEFLGALDAAGQASGRRALIIVDALNEGQGRILWRPHLSAFLAHIEKHRWLAVAVSVRSSYEEAVIPEEVLSEGYEVEHEGFSGVEYHAVRTYFSHYGLEFPSTPVLQPEFTNPLFLKTICKGLRKSGLKSLPRGFHGITAAFNFYIDAINRELAKRLDYDSTQNLVRECLNDFATMLGEIGQTWISRKEISDHINAKLPGRRFTESLYKNLVDEGVFTEEIASGGKGQLQEIVIVSYERFGDHLAVWHQLSKHFDPEHPTKAFSKGGGLEGLNDRGLPLSPGILESYCIQIPEICQRELPDLVPSVVEAWGFEEAYTRSLIWRAPDSISDSTTTWIQQLFLESEESNLCLDALVTLGSVRDHPLNADYLDRVLRRLPMPDRDVRWSEFVHRSWGSGESVDRLIDWSLEVADESEVDDDIIRLCTVVLIWLLASSNRSLRDTATKALVGLVGARPEIVCGAIGRFGGVDDPYILERLYAFAYGIVMRSQSPREVRLIAEMVYKAFYDQDTVIAHILTRDYARGVLERAVALGCDDGFDVSRFRPPYRSEWPAIPELEEVLTLYPDNDDSGFDGRSAAWSRTAIRESVMHGDFARYIIGTNSGACDWLALKIGEEPWIAPRKKLELELAGVGPDARQAFGDYEQILYELDITVSLYALQSGMPNDEGMVQEKGTQDTPEIDRVVEELRRRKAGFMATIPEARLPKVAVLLQDLLDENRKRPPRLKLELIQRYILWRVADLGWTIERFGLFDRFEVRSDGRAGPSAERIGKKYQWIAFHEILAYLSDHYQFRECFREDEGKQAYEGAWQLSSRGIDPSNILLTKPGAGSWNGHKESWWGPMRCCKWDVRVDHKDWIDQKEDIPNPEELLVVADPVDGELWVNLDGLAVWRQPAPEGVEPSEVDRRELMIRFQSYFVRNTDLEGLRHWADGVDIGSHRMPEPQSVHRLFLGEFGWGPAFKFFSDPYYGHEGWAKPIESCPAKVAATSFTYTPTLQNHPDQAACSSPRMIRS
ncbi:MAG: ATP-binding protein [Krumholzibacteria bacterium]|nr:ATP-binding protein [Candidatus Krumholzibacteria bacterium]